jgi:hypothetical protein
VRTGVAVVLALAIALGGCRTGSGPEATARAYAEALRESRLEDAWALTDSGLAWQQFVAQYASGEARRSRAEAVEKAAASLSIRSGSLILVTDGKRWRVVEPALGEAARRALEAFLSAADSGDFDAAYRLLASELRARYTPQRLEQDFRTEPLALERLARARAALKGEPVLDGRQALFPIAEGKAVRLVREDDGFRVMGLE